jgi:hypothetical protein
MRCEMESAWEAASRGILVGERFYLSIKTALFVIAAWLERPVELVHFAPHTGSRHVSLKLERL